jgi:ADP-ribose pyrophosphatase
MTTDRPPKWTKLQTEKVQDLILFNSHFTGYENPRNQQKVKAVILDAPDWVNIVALTAGEQVVMVEQFRFGLNKPTLEIPAGIIEPGEDPQLAACRELNEETGYNSEKWEYLGYVEPNPAFLTNKCHHYLAAQAVRTHLPELDQGEDILVKTLDLESLKEEIRSGRMRHSLAITALYRDFPIWQKDC